MTQRSRLDAFLLERAVEAGAELREDSPVSQVCPVTWWDSGYRRGVVVWVRGETFRGRTLVAADGVNGVTARLAGLEVRCRQWVGLEGNIEGVPPEWESVLSINMGDSPGGYGWLFPKGDHVNVGLATWRSAGSTLRDRLHRLVRLYGMDPAQLYGVRGYHLPMREPGSVLVKGNVLAVGDAAGLVDPLSGEGIFGAIWSGRAAAEQLANYLAGEIPSLGVYVDQLLQHLGPELSISRQFRDLLNVSPALGVAVARWPAVWKFTCRMVTGQGSFDEVPLPRPILALGSALRGSSW